jgi:multidrug transporter EmrE-like cation transporter
MLELYFLPIIFYFAIATFIKKLYIKHLDAIDLLFLQHILYTIIFIGLFIYIFLYNKKSISKIINRYKKFPKHLYVLMILSIIFSIYAYYLSVMLLRKYDVTVYFPVIRAGTLISVFLIGYFIFNEKINVKQISGVILLLLGIYFIK